MPAGGVVEAFLRPRASGPIEVPPHWFPQLQRDATLEGLLSSLLVTFTRDGQQDSAAALILCRSQYGEIEQRRCFLENQEVYPTQAG